MGKNVGLGMDLIIGVSENDDTKPTTLCTSKAYFVCKP